MEHTFKHARVGRQNVSASENGTVAAASALSCFWAAKEYRGQDGKWHGEYKGTPETIRLRPFTLEEALIVQAFPDQFNIGRLRAVAREGIGNALPPPVMKQMLDFYQLSANSAPPPTKKRKA